MVTVGSDFAESAKQRTDTGLLQPSRWNLVQPNGSFASVIEMPPGQSSPMVSCVFALRQLPPCRGSRDKRIFTLRLIRPFSIALVH